MPAPCPHSSMAYPPALPPSPHMWLPRGPQRGRLVMHLQALHPYQEMQHIRLQKGGWRCAYELILMQISNQSSCRFPGSSYRYNSSICEVVSHVDLWGFLQESLWSGFADRTGRHASKKPEVPASVTSPSGKRKRDTDESSESTKRKRETDRQGASCRASLDSCLPKAHGPICRMSQ